MFKGLSREFGGDFVYVFSLPEEWNEKKKHTHINNILAPTQSPSAGTIPQICLCLCVFFPRRYPTLQYIAR